MVSTKILEPLEFDAGTTTKEEIAPNAPLKETAKRIYTLIDTYDKSDTDLGSITIQDFFKGYGIPNLQRRNDFFLLNDPLRIKSSIPENRKVENRNNSSIYTENHDRSKAY